MVFTKEPFQIFDLIFLLFDLPLLCRQLLLVFLESVYQGNRDSIVLDAFDLALGVVGHQQRLNLLNFFRAEAQIAHPSVFPGEADWLKAVDDSHACGKRA